VTIPREIVARELAAAWLPGGTDAGEPIRAFYADAEALFPILPAQVFVEPDTPASSWGLAWYHGLTPDGEPRFAVRDDVVINSKIGYHESGHAFEDVLTRLLAAKAGASPSDMILRFRASYWTWRGFPGTWIDALNYANSLTGAGAGWPYLPGESIAEAFSAGVSGIVQSEWTTTYGLDLALAPGNIYAPIRGGLMARAFFKSFMEELDMALTDDEINKIADAVATKLAPKLDSGFNNTIPVMLRRTIRSLLSPLTRRDPAGDFSHGTPPSAYPDDSLPIA